MSSARDFVECPPKGTSGRKLALLDEAGLHQEYEKRPSCRITNAKVSSEAQAKCHAKVPVEYTL